MFCHEWVSKSQFMLVIKSISAVQYSCNTRNSAENGTQAYDNPIGHNMCLDCWTWSQHVLLHWIISMHSQTYFTYKWMFESVNTTYNEQKQD